MKHLRFASLAFLLAAGLSASVIAAPEPPMRETLASIDSVIARETAITIDSAPDSLWLDNRRLLFRPDDTKLDIALVTVGPGVERKALTTDAWLRPALAAAGAPSRVSLDGMSDDGGVLFVLGNGNVYAIDLATHRAALDPVRTRAADLGRARTLSDQFPTTFGPLVEAASPDGTRFVGRRDDNVYVRRTGNAALRMLTHDGTPRVSWLDTEESAQGLNALWSPDGRRIAAVRLDSSGVAYEPLMRWLRRSPGIDYVAYPRAGDPIHRFELAVIDADTGARTPIRTGDTRDHYVNLLGWLADGRSLLYQVVDREQKSLIIYKADVATGDVRPILRETRATYIDTPMTLSPVLVHPLASGGFLYLSERDGWRHLYRYDGDGRLVRRLTSGPWAVENVVRIDARWVYFRAARDAAYIASLYRVPLDGGALQRVAGNDANVGEPTFAPDAEHLVTISSGPGRMPVATLRDSAGRALATLSAGQAAAALPLLERVETRSVDGRFAIDGLVLRPKDFDPARRYPVVEILYGGMQLDFLPRDAYGTGWWRSGYNALMGRLLANRGYVVVYSSAPGTPGRGRAFQDATYGIWPQTVITNHAKFIRDAAATRPWMDLSRVGVFGNSWGGYLAQRALIDAPDLYRAAVSLAPPSDFSDHPTYIEPFMGLPQHNPAGYAAGSNLDRVAQITGSVLVMPEPLDVNAGFSPAMKFVDAMIRVGGDVELFTMPDVNHRVNCCGWTRERYAYAVAARFLDRKLMLQQ